MQEQDSSKMIPEHSMGGEREKLKKPDPGRGT